MYWVLDQTGRFCWRPYYRAAEIDYLCERRVRQFLHDRYGAVRYPLATDDLTRLIEQEADDLDLFADLSAGGPHGAEVEGVTTFVAGRRPRVRIARELSERPERQARLRTTLAHELGHVLLHRQVVNYNATASVRDDVPPPVAVPPCTTETVRGVRRVDWIEWQAGYASGALLMPRMAVCVVLRPVLRHTDLKRHGQTRITGRLIDAIQGHFLVSDAAALVRLRQLGLAP